MTFIDAIKASPLEVDFVSYKSNDQWVVIQRRSDGIWDTCANLTSFGYSIFTSGVADRGLTLWSYEGRQFIVGDVGDLDDGVVGEELEPGYRYRDYAGQGEA